jgi:hypothetical protein
MLAFKQMRDEHSRPRLERSVLVIEADHARRRWVSTALRELGFWVAAAVTVDEGLEFLRAYCFSALLHDGRAVDVYARGVREGLIEPSLTACVRTSAGVDCVRAVAGALMPEVRAV